jgi:hypothetical protein
LGRRFSTEKTCRCAPAFFFGFHKYGETGGSHIPPPPPRTCENRRPKEKGELQNSLNDIDLDDSETSVSMEQIRKSFKKARDMFREGRLINTKKLVELFIDRVIVFKDHIDIYYNFRPNFQLPQVDIDFKKSAANQKPFLSDKRKIGCADKTPTDSSSYSTTYRGYNGGKRGIRTPGWY